MPSSRTAQRGRLEASERVTLLFISGGYRQTVAALCAQAGIPERTFYNYFPSKADAIRPVLERGIERLVATVATAPPSSPLQQVMVAAFRASLWGKGGVHTRGVVSLVLREPPLEAVWLSTIRSFEAAIAAAVRPRSQAAPDSPEEHMVAAALVAAVRISFEQMAQHGTDPVRTFYRALTAVRLPVLGDQGRS